MYEIEEATIEEHETMVSNVEHLADSVVGRKIVSAENERIEGSPVYYRYGSAFVITLDDGTKVQLFEGGDCCAYTELREFLLHPDRVDHIITGVKTEGEYEKWHIYADMGDVLELTVGWSAGNFPYYGYGFDIVVVRP